MRKPMNLLWCVLFCICLFKSGTVSVADEIYNLEVLEEVHDLYNYNEDFLDILKKKEAFSYRMIADYYEKNKFMNWATNQAALLTGEYISEDDYVEILSEIMILNQYEISEQIAEQGKYNTSKDLMDFLNDAADVVTDVDGISLLFGVDDTKSEFICEALNEGENLWSKGRELDELTEDGKKYYQALLENYVSSDKFLTAVANHAKIKKQRNAAKKLIKVNDEMFLKQYYFLDKMVEDVTMFSAELFVSEVMEPASDFLMEYAADEGTKTILKVFSDIGGKISLFQKTFNLMMFFGNYSFGTSDTFAYLQRIKAINDIASCISDEVDGIHIEDYTDSIEQYEAILNKCTWYRWLITVDARGESYACAMLTNANNGLSGIDDLIRMFKGELTMEEKYDLQLDTLVGFDKNYLQTVLNIDVFANRSEYEDAMNKYLEFAKQYGAGAFYAIENIKEGGGPILLLAFPSENEWECEVLDENNIYSNSCDVYGYVNGEVIQLGSLRNLIGYLPVYRSEGQDYIMTRNNSHSCFFYCVKDDSTYYYAYNTNNIQEDTVKYEAQGEYHDYAYGTTNYKDAIAAYSEVGDIVFTKCIEGQSQSTAESQALVDYYNSYGWYQDVASTENPMYELIDIEQDGIPELVIRTGANSEVAYYIYCYDKDTAQITYAGIFANGFNSTPALYYSPSMKALSTYGRTSDSHWDMFYQLDNGEISLMPFETGWFDLKNEEYVRHYYVSDDTEERKEIASANWLDDEAGREAAETYYSYISDLEYITFGCLAYETCYSHGEDMLEQECQHEVYVWN